MTRSFDYLVIFIIIIMFIKVRNKNGLSGLNTPVECSSIRLREELKAYYVNKKKQLTPLVRANNISLLQTNRPALGRNQLEDKLRQPFGFDKHKLQSLIKEQINILKKNAQCIRKSISKYSLNKDRVNQAMKECFNSYAFVQKSRRTSQCNQDNLIPNFENIDISQSKLKVSLLNENSITKILKRISTRKKTNRVKVYSRLETQNLSKRSQQQVKKREAIKSFSKRKNSRSSLQKSNSEMKTKLVKNNSNISVSKLHLDRLNIKLLSSLSQLSPWKQESNEQCFILPPMKEWER